MWKLAAALATRQYEAKNMQYQEERPILDDDFCRFMIMFIINYF
jgi:hypothetical protein